VGKGEIMDLSSDQGFVRGHLLKHLLLVGGSTESERGWVHDGDSLWTSKGDMLWLLLRGTYQFDRGVL
jgi:hypothetical protein